MRLQFLGDTNELLSGIDILSRDLSFSIAEDGTQVKVVQAAGNISVEYDGKKASISYERKNHFFRALGLLVEGLRKGESFKIIEEPQFDMNGAMFDVSRGSVLKLSSVKRLLEKMALMGLNMMMLYTEDVYSMEGRPYFGYMRGRYSYEELKECDDYAHLLGIEIIPCMQTLSHMEQFLKWTCSEDVKDTNRTLLAECESTYEFIEQMIRTITAPFRSKRILLGMDETEDIGTGNYLKKNDYRKGFDIIREHLARVNDIVEKLGLKPMIWGDMFMVNASTNGSQYDYNSVITDELRQSIPQGVKIVYWDYYGTNEKHYDTMLSLYKQLKVSPVMAGGIWTWMGFCTSYGATFINTNAALSACKKQGIKEVIATLWFDDGAENNAFSSLLGLQLFAEHGYARELDTEKLKRRFKFVTGADFDAFMDLKYLDETEGSLPDNIHLDNPSKFLMWQDVLMGLFDRHVSDFDIAGHYARTEQLLASHRDPENEWDFVLEIPHKVCTVLKLKSDMGLRIRQMYVDGDMEGLKYIIENELPQLAAAVEDLRKAHRRQWFKTYKPFGWEVLDLRYGGLLSRLDSTRERLQDYVEGRVDRIEELEEERLYFDCVEENRIAQLCHCNNYNRIVSPGLSS